MQVKTIWAARAISVLFPAITNIGGFRQDPLQWHPNGLAIDVMIPNHGTDEGIELGNQIAGYALANANRWGVIHVIWRQGYCPGIGAPSWTADYGNETANHSTTFISPPTAADTRPATKPTTSDPAPWAQSFSQKEAASNPERFKMTRN